MSALSIPDIAFQKSLYAPKGSLTAEATMMKGQFGKREDVSHLFGMLCNLLWNLHQKIPIPIQERMCHLCLEFAAAAAQWFTLHYNGLHWQQSAYLLHLYTLITSYTSYCNNLFNLGLGSSIKTLVIDNYKC